MLLGFAAQSRETLINDDAVSESIGMSLCNVATNDLAGASDGCRRSRGDVGGDDLRISRCSLE